MVKELGLQTITSEFDSHFAFHYSDLVTYGQVTLKATILTKSLKLSCHEPILYFGGWPINYSRCFKRHEACVLVGITLS